MTAAYPDLIGTVIADLFADTKLIKDARLAEFLDMPVRRLQEIRLREDWPHIKVGRTYRYGPEEVVEIIRRHRHKGAAPLVGLPDQTEESIRRSQR